MTVKSEKIILSSDLVYFIMCNLGKMFIFLKPASLLNLAEKRVQE